MHTQPVLAVHTVILTAVSSEQAAALEHEIIAKRNSGLPWHCFRIPCIAPVIRRKKVVTFMVSTEGDMQAATAAAGRAEIHHHVSTDKFVNPRNKHP